MAARRLALPPRPLLREEGLRWPRALYVGTLFFFLSLAVFAIAWCRFTADVETKKTYAEKGFDGILLKPANIESLRRVLG